MEQKNSNINIEYYKVFYEVANRLSFSAAAESLYITQPAVSQTINTLEKNLGIKLFSRNSKGVRLTREGQELFCYIEPALNLIKSGESKIKELIKLERGEVKIAAADTISKHLLIPSLEQFNEMYPHINISVINRTTRECIDLLNTSSADIAFINLPIDNEDGFVVTPFLNVHDIFVAGQKYNNIKGTVLSAQELSKLPLILLEQKSNSRRYIDSYFLEHSVTLQPEIELGSHDLLLEFSKIGLGVSCVIKEFSMHYLNSGELFEINLNPPIMDRYIAMAHSSNIPLSKAAASFVKLIKSQNKTEMQL